VQEAWLGQGRFSWIRTNIHGCTLHFPTFLFHQTRKHRTQFEGTQSQASDFCLPEQPGLWGRNSNFRLRLHHLEVFGSTFDHPKFHGLRSHNSADNYVNVNAWTATNSVFGHMFHKTLGVDARPSPRLTLGPQIVCDRVMVHSQNNVQCHVVGAIKWREFSIHLQCMWDFPHRRSSLSRTHCCH